MASAKVQCPNSAYSLQLLLLDSNETGGLIVMNVLYLTLPYLQGRPHPQAPSSAQAIRWAHRAMRILVKPKAR